MTALLVGLCLIAFVAGTFHGAYTDASSNVTYQNFVLASSVLFAASGLLLTGFGLAKVLS